MTFITVALNAGHRKDAFVCGKPMLDNYIQRQARQDIKRMLSACFVLEAENGFIKGYYTLSSASVASELLPEELKKRLPPSYTDLPVILLGRLAISAEYQRQGLGEVLLVDALKRSYYTSKTVGSIAVVVDPLDPDAVHFYQHYGFVSLHDSGRMFLSMGTIAQLFE